MGRKIPAKKHRGVKDPLVQQARRLHSLKGKINAPPKDPDDQPVPKTLTRLFAFQNRDKTIKKKKKNKKWLSAGLGVVTAPYTTPKEHVKYLGVWMEMPQFQETHKGGSQQSTESHGSAVQTNANKRRSQGEQAEGADISPPFRNSIRSTSIRRSYEDGMGASGVSSNPVSRLRKLPGESGREFSLRINSAVRALHDPLDQHHYPDDVESEDEKGEVMSAQRERRRRKRQGAGAAAGADGAASRAQRLALRKREKKGKAAEEAAWAQRTQVQYERVQFGDVAHAPPVLRAPRHAPPAPKPARRGLLLSAMLGAGAAAAGAGAAERAAEARERARLDVVAAYRALKKERRLRGGAAPE